MVYVIEPTGPRGAASPTGYDAIGFASIMDTKQAGTASIGNTRKFLVLVIT